MADLSQQLRLQQELNKTLKERQGLLEANTSAFSQQAKMAQTLNQAMQGGNLDSMREKVSGVRQGMDDAARSTRNAAKQTRDLGKAAQDAGDDFDEFKKKAIGIGAAIGALKGLRLGISMVTGVFKAGFRVVKSFIKGVFNIGKAILSIPFKMWNALMNMGGGGGSPVFLQALEKIRETFGDIKTGSGKALADSARELRREFTKMTGATDVFRGPTFGKVFGYGREGLAKALEFNAEMATALGGSFASMRDGMKGNFAELAIYRKGLGLSADAMANFMKLNEYGGKDYMKGFEELSNLAIQVGENFGFSAKEVGRNLSNLLEDVKNFGGFTEKQLVQMSVQTMRLGLEMKTLTGVVDAFDSFDDAVTKVGNLHRMFGMSLDAMKMFREEDPVKRIQMLQRSFKSAGNDIEKMNRRQVSFLAQQAGIDEKAARIMFSKKGLEMDYNATKKATEKAQKKQLKTAEVLAKLSRQIERIFGGGGGKYKGFFDAFAKGFGKGVRYSREFRKVMININRSLRITELFGRRVGRSFVKNFPGVKQFLGALADFFNPRKLAPALRQISREFDNFFKMLRPGNERKAFDQMGKNVMKILRQYFGGKGEAIELMRQAGTIIGEIMINLKLIAAEKAAKNAAVGVELFTKALQGFIRRRKSKETGALISDSITDGIKEKFGENAGKLADTIMDDLVPALKKAGPVIMDALFEIFGMMREYVDKHIDKVSDAIISTLKLIFKVKMNVISRALSADPMMGMVIAGMILGPTTVMMVGGALKSMLGLAIGSFAGKYAGGSVLAKTIFGGQGVASRAFQASASGMGKAAGTASVKSFTKAHSKGISKELGRGAMFEFTERMAGSQAKALAKNKGLLDAAEAAKKAKNFGEASKLMTQHAANVDKYMSRAAATHKGIMRKAAEKVATETGEQVVKKSFIQGAKQMAKTGGAKAVGAALGSVVPGLGTAVGFAVGAIIDAGFAFANYEETAAETGQSGAAAFTGEFISNMTLGLYDAADVMDDFGLSDGFARANQTTKREAPHLARHFKMALEELKPAHDAIKSRFEELSNYTFGVADQGKDFLHKHRGKMTSDFAAFFDDFIGAHEDANQRLEDAQKNFNLLKDEQGAGLGAWNRMMEQAAEQGTDTISNDIYVSMAGASEKHLEMMRKRIHDYAKSIGEDPAEMLTESLDKQGNVVFELHNDLYDRAHLHEGFQALTVGLKNDMMKELDEVAALQKREERLFKDRGKYSDEVLKARYQEAAKLGAVDMRDSLKAELHARAQEVVAKQKAAIFQETLEGMVGSVSKADEKLIAAMAKGDISASKGLFESINDVNPSKATQLKKLLGDSVHETTNQLLGVKNAAAFEEAAMLTPEQKQLNELEAARDQVAQIESLAGIPDKLAKLKRKLDKVNTKTVARNIAKVMTITRQVASAINAELNKPENKGMTETKERSIIDTAVVDNVELLKKMTEGISTISAKTGKLPQQSTLDARRIKLVDSWETVVKMIGEINKASGSELGLSAATADGLHSMNTIVNGFGFTIPKNLKEKIAASTVAIRAAQENLRQISKLTGEARADAVLNLVSAINSGGTLTVKSENEHHPIKVNIKLDVNARELGNSLVKVQGVKKGVANSRIMVTAEKYTSDNPLAGGTFTKAK